MFLLQTKKAVMDYKISKAKVKWFSQEKGYGYVTNQENIDLYFVVKDVIGPDLPHNGDEIEFEEYLGIKSEKAARNIKILSPNNPDYKKIHCSSCKKEVIPRSWVYGGSDYTYPKHEHYCPSCGSLLYRTGGGFNTYTKIVLTIIVTIFIYIIYLLT